MKFATVTDKLVRSLKARLKNQLNTDNWSVLMPSRWAHYALNKYLWEKYSPEKSKVDLQCIPSTDYIIPAYLLKLPQCSRNCISGGLQFHSEFEEYMLSNNFQVHIYEIDPVSWQWFELNRGGNPSFVLHKKGLFNINTISSFYGDSNRNTSPSILSDFHDDSRIAEVGQCRLITLKEASSESSLSTLALVKLDIEGVALRVISQALNDHLIVSCFVFEAERPIGSKSKAAPYFFELIEAITLLERHGYQVLCYPRNDNFNSFSTLCTAFKVDQ